MTEYSIFRLDFHQIEHFSIKNQLRNGLQSSSPGSIYITIDHLLIKIQLRNGIQSSRLDID